MMQPKNTSPAPVYQPGPHERTVRDAQGQIKAVPDDWDLLLPGDAALTRRVKAAGEHWIVQERRGRKVFSRGLWAPARTIAQIQSDLTTERSTPVYAKKRAAGVQRREKEHHAYVEDFHGAVVAFLGFHPQHAELAETFARAVTAHATPVGSGTVARTQRIPIEQRAESAVIAWMRHQTTGYDQMHIPRAKGLRREIRQSLARRSRELLQHYRQGNPPPPNCPLQAAVTDSAQQSE